MVHEILSLFGLANIILDHSIYESNLMKIIYDCTNNILKRTMLNVKIIANQTKRNILLQTKKEKQHKKEIHIHICQQEPDLKCNDFSMFIGAKHVYTWMIINSFRRNNKIIVEIKQKSFSERQFIEYFPWIW